MQQFPNASAMPRCSHAPRSDIRSDVKRISTLPARLVDQTFIRTNVIGKNPRIHGRRSEETSPNASKAGVRGYRKRPSD